MNLILIDQDGVLADFDQGVAQQWRWRFATDWPLQEPRRHFYLHDDLPQWRDALHELYRSKGFFEQLPPVEGALAAVQTLLQAGLDVRICTSPMDEYRHCVGEKIAWVEQHLGSEWTRRVIVTKDKTWVRGDVLIDDKPQVSGSLKPVWQHWLYDRPYNRHLNQPRVCWQNEDSWRVLLPDDQAA